MGVAGPIGGVRHVPASCSRSASVPWADRRCDSEKWPRLLRAADAGQGRPRWEMDGQQGGAFAPWARANTSATLQRGRLRGPDPAGAARRPRVERARLAGAARTAVSSAGKARRCCWLSTRATPSSRLASGSPGRSSSSAEFPMASAKPAQALLPHGHGAIVVRAAHARVLAQRGPELGARAVVGTGVAVGPAHEDAGLRDGTRLRDAREQDGGGIGVAEGEVLAGQGEGQLQVRGGGGRRRLQLPPGLVAPSAGRESTGQQHRHSLRSAVRRRRAASLHASGTTLHRGQPSQSIHPSGGPCGRAVPPSPARRASWPRGGHRPLKGGRRPSAAWFPEARERSMRRRALPGRRLRRAAAASACARSVKTTRPHKNPLDKAAPLATSVTCFKVLTNLGGGHAAEPRLPWLRSSPLPSRFPRRPETRARSSAPDRPHGSGHPRGQFTVERDTASRARAHHSSGIDSSPAAWAATASRSSIPGSSRRCVAGWP